MLEIDDNSLQGAQVLEIKQGQLYFSALYKHTSLHHLLLLLLVLHGLVVEATPYFQ